MSATKLAISFLTMFFSGFAAVPHAAAEKKVALVVGIDTYDNLEPRSQLKKARADAVAVARSLKALGFEVIHREELGRSAFNTAWQEFLDKLSPGDTAAFFFSGHGIELGGRNYLLPRDIPDVRPGRDELLKRESLSLQEFLADLREKGTQLNLIIVDACRDNPFAAVAGRSIGGSRGLAVTEPPEGTFIMYSAGTGESALDRLSDRDSDPNSVYTRHLLPLMIKPSLTLTDVAEQVRVSVREMASTIKHRQTPAYYNQVLGKACLAGCTPVSSAAATSEVDMAMKQCITEPLHIASAEMADRLALELSKNKWQYGWWEEAAAKSGATVAPDRTVFRRDVALIQALNGELKISYNWQNGYLRLKAVAPMAAATRGARPKGAGSDYPRLTGSNFQGIWVQDNSYGCVELNFSPSGEASGKWGIKMDPLDSDVFLRRAE